MKSDYSRDIFKQLEETMKRLDKMESTLENTKIQHKIEIGHLNDKIAFLEKHHFTTFNSGIPLNEVHILGALL